MVADGHLFPRVSSYLSFKYPTIGKKIDPVHGPGIENPKPRRLTGNPAQGVFSTDLRPLNCIRFNTDCGVSTAADKGESAHLTSAECLFALHVLGFSTCRDETDDAL